MGKDPRNRTRALFVSALETTWQDVRYGLRMLGKSPGFGAVVALSLALGIGANTAIFSLIDAVLLRMLPVRDPAQLLLVGRSRGGGTAYGFTYSQFRLLRDHNRFFEGLAAYSPVRLNVSVDGHPEPTSEGQLVTGGYFPLLGVGAAAGRTIGPEEDRVPNGHPVAMISYGYWKRRFALDPAVIGRTIALCGTPFTVIGVAPAEFFGLEVGTSPDFFVPSMMQPAVMPAAENWLGDSIIIATWLRTFGRLRPGSPPESARAELEALHHQDPALDKGGRPMWRAERIVLTPAGRGLSELRRQFSQPLFILMTVVALVLVIACANVANLLLARGAARRSEFSMRLALGAGRWRLMRQLLVESLLLATLGGLLGVLLAYQGTRFLVDFMSAGRTPFVVDLRPDGRVLAFTAAVSLLTGILFGFAPALRASRIDLSPGLKAQAGRVGSLGAGPGKALVVFQVALSLVLLAGAGLFVRSLQKLNGQDDGFPRESVLVVRVEPKGSDQRGVPGASARLDRIYRDLLQRVESIPGVRSASLGHFAPTSRVGFSSPVRLPSGEQADVPRLMVYPGYFATMGIPMTAGRDFNAGDLDERSPLVAVVNDAFARKVLQDRNPIGKRYFTRPPGRRDALPCEIIGVVRDSRYASLRGETPPLIYQPFLQTNSGRGQMSLHVRAAAAPGLVVPRIREEILRIDKDLPTFEVRTLAEEMSAALVQERLIATLSTFFGALALVLACVGLYGLMAFAAVRRTAEMGIRMALGAGRAHVAWVILRSALRLILLGVALGVPAAYAAARLASSHISGLLFGLTATDPATIAAATGILILAATVAGYLPARRASRVDPIVALRSE